MLLVFAALGCSNGADEALNNGSMAGDGGSRHGGGMFGAGGGGASSGTSARGGTVVGAGAGGATSGGSAGTGGGAPAGAGGTTGGSAGPTGGSAGDGENGATGGRLAIGGMTALGGAGQTGSAGQGGTTEGGRSAGGAGSGGVATAGASSGGSAGEGYRACPASPCKIMPFGDSITFGVGDESNGGYRGPLFASIVAAGQKVTFTGSLSNGPSTVLGEAFPKKNEGHSGWGISQVTPYSNNNAGIATVIPNPGFSSGSGGVPDIILLHIGTNDQGSFSASQMTSDLSGLLDKLITNAPNAYLVVAQIIPLGYGANTVIKTYNESIPGLVKSRADAGKHIAIVDMFTDYTPGSMLGSDSIHPNAAGYKFMADRWYSVIGPLLPK